MDERAAHVTDFDATASKNPLPLEPVGEPGDSGITKRDDSASGKIAFMEQNAKLDTEYSLPGGGTDSNGSWVSWQDYAWTSRYCLQFDSLATLQLCRIHTLLIPASCRYCIWCTYVMLRCPARKAGPTIVNTDHDRVKSAIYAVAGPQLSFMQVHAAFHNVTAMVGAGVLGLPNAMVRQAIATDCLPLQVDAMFTG